LLISKRIANKTLRAAKTASTKISTGVKKQQIYLLNNLLTLDSFAIYSAGFQLGDNRRVCLEKEKSCYLDLQALVFNLLVESQELRAYFMLLATIRNAGKIHPIVHGVHFLDY